MNSPKEHKQQLLLWSALAFYFEAMINPF